MRCKEVLYSTLFLSVLALTGCDGLTWGGASVEVVPPFSKEIEESPLVPPDSIDDVGPVVEPLDLPPLIYWVFPTETGGAILPVAAWDGGAWGSLPSIDTQPDFMIRFAKGRWEPGTEFLLFQGPRRAGTLIADGSITEDQSTCRPRPRGAGHLELRPDARETPGFLAIRRADWSADQLTHIMGMEAPLPDHASAAQQRQQALAAARVTLERARIPWPPSLPDILEEVHPLTLRDGSAGLGATLTFGGGLTTGRVAGAGYGLFFVATTNVDGQWVPVWSWYQTTRGGKAFPRVAGSGTPFNGADPLLLLEVFGDDDRWLVLLGEDGDGEWAVRYADSCGQTPPRGAIRSWR